MKASHLEQLKLISRDVLMAMPENLTVNGNKELFCHGEPLNLLTLLSDIEKARAGMEELNEIIQSIQPRKAGK